MPGVFVTATGTEVGKTFVTAGLIRAARRAGLPVDAMKPLLSGYDPRDVATSDAAVLLAALGIDVDDAAIARMSPWRFAAPLAPNMAAALEDRTIDLADVVAACRRAVNPDRLTLVEGIGGLMVPLDGRHTVLDLIAVLDLPVVLVAGTGLGALSHGLTAIAALRARTNAPTLIVLNESEGSTVPLDATRATLAGFHPQLPFAVLPREADAADFDRLLTQVRSL